MYTYILEIWSATKDYASNSMRRREWMRYKWLYTRSSGSCKGRASLWETNKKKLSIASLYSWQPDDMLLFRFSASFPQTNKQTSNVSTIYLLRIFFISTKCAHCVPTSNTSLFLSILITNRYNDKYFSWPNHHRNRHAHISLPYRTSVNCRSNERKPSFWLLNIVVAFQAFWDDSLDLFRFH